MDIALLKKMMVYPTDAKLAGLIPEEGDGPSTLIKADISLFHEGPRPVETRSEPKDALPSEYERGLAEGKAKSDAVHSETIKLLQNAVNTMQSQMGARVKEIEQGHLSVMKSFMEAIFPTLMRTGIEAELQEILKEASSLSDAAKILLSVHPEDIEICERVCQAHSDNIIISGVNDIPKGQVKIEWNQGGAMVDCQSIADRCLQIAEAALAQLSLKN